MDTNDEKLNEQTAEQQADNTTQPDVDATQPDIEEPQPKEEDKKKHHAKETIEDKLQQIGERLAEKEDQYKRLYADFENHRKRTNIEKADLILNGGKEVIKSLLPVIDDLERAMLNMPEGDAMADGIKLIYNKLMKTLEQKGLKAMESKGQPFDEELHEAVTRIPATDESQKGTIVDVVEKGYYLNDRVLRFAKVVVAF